jgi:ribonucleotide monophosphatase NagD (HAD superfamily)
MGKPENFLCSLFLQEEIKLHSDKILMIGDRLNTDILFGSNNGFKTLLVESGVHKLDEVQEIINRINEVGSDVELEKQIPDFVISSLGDLFNNCED